MPDAAHADPANQADPAAQADEARSRQLFESSQTFLLRSPDQKVMWSRIIAVGAIALLFFVVVPLLASTGLAPTYKINILGRYLCLAIVALGIDLIWGYTGLLSLCQALFFALGAYAMGMHLSLPEGGGQYAVPQFLSFAYYGHANPLPPFWQPFRHFWFAVLAGIVVPGLVATVFGFFILRSRVRGVYFSIITQALAWATWLLMSRNEMLMGGTNGLTNFYRPLSQDKHWIIGLYLLTLVFLTLSYLLCRLLVKSRLGRILVAIRDKETRLYFAGYKPYAFKVFAFAVGAMLAGVGGMLYAPQTGNITPQEMNTEASIFMVVMVALGGRGRLWGAVFGALLFTVARSALSSDFAGAWILVEGLIAIGVVLFFPEGFSGLWTTMERELAGGAELWRAALTASPLIVVAIFVLLEALGLIPAFFRGDTFKPIGIAPKYWVLGIILITLAVLNYLQRRAVRATAKRGFEVMSADPAVAPADAASPTGGA